MKKTLFAVALLASSSAFAMDVSNPFYVPMKGDFLSESSIVYENFEHGADESAILTETLSYGVTRNFSVNATVEDTWLFDTKGVTGHDRYDNPAWGIGMKYNLVDCCKTNWKLQLGANYEQGGVDHHDKSLSGYVKGGYQMGRFLPYLTVAVDKPVGKYEGQPAIETRAALNTVLTKKTNLDLGINYNWDNDTFNGKHISAWAADAGFNYVFSDCMSAGINGLYIMRTKPTDLDGYQVGVNFKVAF
ncbi:MAG: hypothetical protein SPL08_02290 [Pseudomonadota bacterium]|nr:hypothetical protein [Pseudomonadota bacterium]